MRSDEEEVRGGQRMLDNTRGGQRMSEKVKEVK
jgi:hypothetical protein